jgi:predicted GTPase
MTFGAGVIATQRYGAAALVDPRPYLVGTLKDTFETYPDIGSVLPAMGYGDQQIKDLEATINACDCDFVISATPIDLAKLIQIEKPILRVRYGYDDNGEPTLGELILNSIET